MKSGYSYNTLCKRLIFNFCHSFAKFLGQKESKAVINQKSYTVNTQVYSKLHFFYKMFVKVAKPTIKTFISKILSTPR